MTSNDGMPAAIGFCLPATFLDAEISVQGKKTLARRQIYSAQSQIMWPSSSPLYMVLYQWKYKNYLSIS
jgi:hypothetical protein